jgi:hypothetical protein
MTGDITTEAGKYRMDVAYVSTFAALGGSVVGGLISGIATWLAQRSQILAGHRAHQMSHREELFRDFILAASKAHGQAMMSDQPDLEALITMYGAINRMEVLCSPRTVECAHRAARKTIETYFEPNRTLPDILAGAKSGAAFNPLSEFAEAAREELRTLVSR